MVAAKLSYAQAKEQVDSFKRDNTRLGQLLSEVNGQLANAKARALPPTAATTKSFFSVLRAILFSARPSRSPRPGVSVVKSPRLGVLIVKDVSLFGLECPERPGYISYRPLFKLPQSPASAAAQAMSSPGCSMCVRPVLKPL